MVSGVQQAMVQFSLHVLKQQRQPTAGVIPWAYCHFSSSRGAPALTGVCQVAASVCGVLRYAVLCLLAAWGGWHMNSCSVGHT